jgi:biopolymer transport protein TolQ
MFAAASLSSGALGAASLAASPKTGGLDPLSLIRQSSGVVLVVLVLLILCSFSVWLIWFLKSMQLRRLQAAQDRFERDAAGVAEASALVALGIQHKAAPGGRVVVEMAKRPRSNLTAEFLASVAKRAIVSEQQRAGVLMPTLSSIASSAPFIGLFGTVWGIMDAFLRIGAEGSASLPVVAPAIGEALIATAVGLVAAIPATIGYNYIDQRIVDLLAGLEASSETWVEILATDAAERRSQSGVPINNPSQRPTHQPRFGG